MDNNTNHTTAAAAGEKKNSVKALLEKGKSTGKLIGKSLSLFDQTVANGGLRRRGGLGR